MVAWYSYSCCCFFLAFFFHLHLHPEPFGSVTQNVVLKQNTDQFCSVPMTNHRKFKHQRLHYTFGHPDWNLCVHKDSTNQHIKRCYCLDIHLFSQATWSQTQRVWDEGSMAKWSEKNQGQDLGSFFFLWKVHLDNLNGCLFPGGSKVAGFRALEKSSLASWEFRRNPWDLRKNRGAWAKLLELVELFLGCAFRIHPFQQQSWQLVHCG